MELFTEPIHSIIYITIVLTIFSLFSKVLVDVSDVSWELAKDIKKQFKDQDGAIAKIRIESIKK